MSTLAEFLLARITEDERAATVPVPCPEAHRYADRLCGVLHTQIDRRVLAECEAKRQIVEDWQAALDRHIDESQPTDGEDFWAGGEWGIAYAVRALAAVYADRPDYREEWRR